MTTEPNAKGNHQELPTYTFQLSSLSASFYLVGTAWPCLVVEGKSRGRNALLQIAILLTDAELSYSPCEDATIIVIILISLALSSIFNHLESQNSFINLKENSHMECESNVHFLCNGFSSLRHYIFHVILHSLF